MIIISMTAVIPTTPATAPIIIGNGIVGSPSELGGGVIVGMELLLMVVWSRWVWLWCCLAAQMKDKAHLKNSCMTIFRILILPMCVQQFTYQYSPQSAVCLGIVQCF